MASGRVRPSLSELADWDSPAFPELEEGAPPSARVVRGRPPAIASTTLPRESRSPQSRADCAESLYTQLQSPSYRPLPLQQLIHRHQPSQSRGSPSSASARQRSGQQSRRAPMHVPSASSWTWTAKDPGQASAAEAHFLAAALVLRSSKAWSSEQRQSPLRRPGRRLRQVPLDLRRSADQLPASQLRVAASSLARPHRRQLLDPPPLFPLRPTSPTRTPRETPTRSTASWRASLARTTTSCAG